MKVIPFTVYYKYGDVFKLKPIFDVHYGASACDVKAFKRYLAESDDHTLFIGGGDLLDSITVKDSRYRKSSDAMSGDDVIDRQINDMTEMLYPYRKQLICLAAGNHEDVITRVCGTNPTKRMAKSLGCKFMGFSGLIRMSFREKGGRGRVVVIRLHHGWGGGSRTQGADLTKYSRDLQYWDADIFLYGHVHRKQTDQVPRIGIVGTKLVSKPKTMAICGTFLKTYTNNEDPTYSEVKGYPPVEVGGVCIDIKPSREWVKINAYLN